MKFIVFIVFVFLQNNSAIAVTPNVEVIKLKGYVSQLYSGVKHAKGLTYEDKFEEDTSILTGTKSIAKLKFIDSTEITIGPNSKVVLSEFRNNSFISINLLKGRLRISQKKTTISQPISFYLKTRNSLIGSSSAEYQVIYNSQNRITSILAFSGEVFFSKFSDRIQGNFSSKTSEIVRDDDSKMPTLVKNKSLSNNFSDISNQLFSSKYAKKVLAGQNSTINDFLEGPTIPVKISINQLQILFQNSDLEERNVSDLRPFLKKDLPHYDVSQADQLAPLEGYKNESLGEYAPKAGGLVDIETGLYISPGNDSIFDDKNRIYFSEMMGKFDEKTGQYIPPKGIILKPVEGFAMADDVSTQPETHALVEDLNSMINKEIILDSKFSENKKDFDLNKKFLRNYLKFSFHNLLISNELNSNLSNQNKLKSKDSFGFSLNWQMASMSRFSPFVGLGFSKIDYLTPSNATMSLDSKKLMDLTFGSLYSLSEFTNFFGVFKLAQDNYIDQTNSASPYNYKFQKVVVAKFSSGISYDFFSKRKFSISTQFAGVFNFRKKINNFIIDKGLGYQFSLIPKYRFSSNKCIELGLFYENNNQKIRNSVMENRLNKITTDFHLSYVFEL